MSHDGCTSCPAGHRDLSARADFAIDRHNWWCTNCGNYGIFGAVQNALVMDNLRPQDVLLCFDIGCNSNGADKITAYAFKGLHGRVIPFACGASIANDRVPIIAFAGDGATLGEGINHFIHAVRTNYNITFILHNNYNYGLTTGQASPSTPDGVPMKGSPYGTTGEQINAVDLTLSLRPSFVARTFSGNVGHMTHVIREAMKHKGFSFVEVLQACPTFNKATPHQWFMERVRDVAKDPDYDPTNLKMARERGLDLTENIAIGVLYRNPDFLDFMSKQQQRAGLTTQLVDEVQAW